MKRSISLLLIVILALSLCACGEKAAEAPAATDTTQPLAGTAVVTKADFLEYSYGGVVARFRLNEQWRWADDEAFPLDGAYVQEILSALDTFSVDSAAASNADPAAYGLSDPQDYLTVSFGTETSTTLHFGTADAEGKTYMYCDDDTSGIYLVPADFLALLSRSIYDMAVLPSLPVLTSDNVSGIMTQSTDDSIHTLVKTEDTWRYNTRDVSDKLEPLFTEISALTLEKCFDYDPSDGVAELCGLAAPESIVSVSYINTVSAKATFVLTIGAVQESSGFYFVMVDENPSIYLMAPEQLTALLSFTRSGL